MFKAEKTHSTATMNVDTWISMHLRQPFDILSRYDVDKDGKLNYEEFENLCLELFHVTDIEKYGHLIFELFKLFDINKDKMLDEKELYRLYKWICLMKGRKDVLVIINVQNDYIDGPMGLHQFGVGRNGLGIVEPINYLLRNGRWYMVVYTQNWHPEDHISFIENLVLRPIHPSSMDKVMQNQVNIFDFVTFEPPYGHQQLLPKHCVRNTLGAALHNDLLIISTHRVHCGRDSHKDMHSAFDNDHMPCLDGCRNLTDLLSDRVNTRVYICGLFYDMCVMTTCLESLRLGYQTAVIEDCCRSINPSDMMKVRESISANGGRILNMHHVLPMVNCNTRSLETTYHLAKCLDVIW